MIHLRCLLGIHHTEWVTPTIDGRWTPPVRRCRDCKREVGRQHRD